MIKQIIRIISNVSAKGSSWQIAINGSGNGLVPNWGQTITRTNDDPDRQSIYSSQGLIVVNTFDF